MSVVREIRKKTGLSQKLFSDHFGIPTHTLQQWEQGARTPPQYVIAMMSRILDFEAKQGVSLVHTPQEKLWEK